MKKILSACFLALLLGGCVSTGHDVGVDVDSCCFGTEASTYTIETVSIPGFLEPLLRSNMNAVLAGEGLQPVDNAGDVVVTMRYEQDELAVATRYSDYDERVSEGGDVRFVARVVVEVRNRAGEMLSSGAIDRIHDVSPGEYMHTGKASVAIYEALVELIKNIR